MNSRQVNEGASGPMRRVHPLVLGLAVVLCIACCGLILLIPTESTNVETVYQGF